MTRRECLEKLVFYYKEAITGRTLSSDNWEKEINKALSDLAQIEQSEKLSVEEIVTILVNKSLSSNVYNQKKEIVGNMQLLSDFEVAAQAIYEAQEKKRGR